MSDSRTPRYAGRREFQQIQKLLREKALESLTGRHRVGALVERLVPAAGKNYGQRSMAVLAEELGLASNSTALTHLREFSKAYTLREVRELEAPMSGSKFRITWGHVIRLISFPRAERVRLERECRLGEWTNAELNRRIRLRRKRITKGGAPLKRPESVSDALVQIQVTAEGWIKRSQRLWIGGDSPVITPESIAGAGREADATVKETAEVLQQLESEARRLRAALEPIPRPRVRRTGRQMR